MNSTANSVTSTTLLLRLQETPSDSSAWAEFVERYGSRIQAWCHQWGLQDADADDVAQTVLVKLLRAMQSFEYDPRLRFRGWLKTVTHHAWQDWVRSRRRIAGAEGTKPDDSLESVAAGDDLAALMDHACEQELLTEAIVRVRPRLQPQTWEAFCLTTYEGLTGVDAAARLGMAVTSIYKAKSSVRKLLEAEVRCLDERH